jgi:hypothetical protein
VNILHVDVLHGGVFAILAQTPNAGQHENHNYLSVT